jgi:large subunit ribosomal protein L1
MVEEEVIKAVNEAISSSKERKFVESIELAINLKEVDLKIPKNRINEEIGLPKGRGREIRIAIFATAELAEKSKGVVDLIIMPEQIEDYSTDKPTARKMANDIDFFLAEAPLMPTIGKSLGTVLGPRGKMPKPVPPNLDPTGMVKALKNTVKIRSKDRKTFHIPVGVKTMSADDLSENIGAVLTRIESRLERGRYNIQSAWVKTSMGPSVRIF